MKLRFLQDYGRFEEGGEIDPTETPDFSPYQADKLTDKEREGEPLAEWLESPDWGSLESLPYYSSYTENENGEQVPETIGLLERARDVADVVDEPIGDNPSKQTLLGFLRTHWHVYRDVWG